MNRDDVMDYCGADNWRQIEAEFSGLTGAEILAKLDGIFEHDDNTHLAAEIARLMGEAAD